MNKEHGTLFLAGTGLGKSQSSEKCHTGAGHVFETALEDHIWWQKVVWRREKKRVSNLDLFKCFTTAFFCCTEEHKEPWVGPGILRADQNRVLNHSSG